MFFPNRQQPLGPLVAATSGKMEERCFARHGSIEAIVAREADLCGTTNQPAENRLGMSGFEQYTIDSRQQLHVPFVAPFGVRQEQVAARERQIFGANMFEQQIGIKALLATQPLP